jgi:hypothetical protein
VVIEALLEVVRRLDHLDHSDHQDGVGRIEKKHRIYVSKVRETILRLDGCMDSNPHRLNPEQTGVTRLGVILERLRLGKPKRDPGRRGAKRERYREVTRAEIEELARSYGVTVDREDRENSVADTHKTGGLGGPGGLSGLPASNGYDIQRAADAVAAGLDHTDRDAAGGGL